VGGFGGEVQNDSEGLQVLTGGVQMAADVGALVIHVDKA
jgi:hypothetical protein